MIRTATRRIEFDAGHRVTRHESKCRNVHGHRYRVEITVQADEVDAVGRVVDFGVVKEIVGSWVDDHLDHGYLGHPEDTVTDTLRAMGHKVFVMPERLGEPTAENIAALMAEVAAGLLSGVRSGLTVVHVRVYETPNCWADWRPDLTGR